MPLPPMLYTPLSAAKSPPLLPYGMLSYATAPSFLAYDARIRRFCLYFRACL
jgi:hypothetical protein